ncbi:MAG: alpha/beta hydrolase [Fuerstiella sp.]
MEAGPDEADDRLARFQKRFPASDADGDGRLTLEEARAFQQTRRQADSQQQNPNTRQKIEPTHADVAYGTHEKQKFDLWLVPDATEPTPLVIYIHGGGFRGGDKRRVNPKQIQSFLDAGVAFASINYRLSDVGPYPIMMHDAARALQTIRHRAEEWGLNAERIACFGGSAGAGISLWLAFHDDLADPNSDDPVARQSTRIHTAGTMNGQSSYDLFTFREWFKVPDLPLHNALPAFLGIESEQDLDDPVKRELMADASPITHLSNDDRVSVYMVYSRPPVKVTRDTPQGVWVHHPLLGLKLKEAMQQYDLECHVVGPGLPDEKDYGSLDAFLMQKVKAPARSQR